MSNVRLFFAFRSPFSWMAIDRLRKLAPDALDTIEWIPYWEPDPRTAEMLAQRGIVLHYSPMSKAKHLYILQDTKRLADRFHLRMTWPVDLNPRWDVPHLAWLKARKLGFARRFYDAVVATRWERGANICDPNVIRSVSESIGLDGETVLSALDDVDIQNEGVRCLSRAYEDDIFGVPYFRLGMHRFWGLDRLDEFLAEFRRYADSHRSPSLTDPLHDTPQELLGAVGAYDSDTAGGCG